MADLEHQLRQHYGSEKLPDERAHAILAAGRAAAATRARQSRWWIGAAAAVVVGLGIAGSMMRFGGKDSPGSSHRITAQDAATAVVNYFSQPDYQLPEISSDRAVLEKWLREHGGPASFTTPEAMTGLPAFGCQVLEARGQKVFLICFFLDALPIEPGAMPIKKEMIVTAPDGTMMKKNRPLVHLVVAPRAAFRDAPQPGQRVRLPAAGEWNFETWSQDDLVYLVAAAAPGGRLAELARTQ